MRHVTNWAEYKENWADYGDATSTLAIEFALALCIPGVIAIAFVVVLFGYAPSVVDEELPYEQTKED